MSTWKKLPARKCFYSPTKEDGKIGDDSKKLDGHTSLKDYLMGKKIWDKFDIKDMSDYDDHYLNKDVLLLADVFEKFIDTCLKFYGLDPCHYFNSPGLSWNVMLKMIGVKLEKYQALTSIYLLKKEWEEEFLTFLQDMQRPITITWITMAIKNRQNL